MHPHALTPGIILRRRNYHEADRILTVYTKNLGKVMVRARGVRKTTSKLGSHLELFNDVFLGLAEGKIWRVVCEAQTRRNFPTIRRSLKRISSAYYISELICLLVREEHRHEDIYFLAADALMCIDSYSNPIIVPAFALNLSSLLGYKPELYRCVVSGERLRPEYLYFSHRLGGVLDSRHRETDRESFPVSAELVKLMRVSLRNIQAIMRLKISQKTRDDYFALVTDYCLYVLSSALGKDKREAIKSEKFFKEMHADMG